MGDYTWQITFLSPPLVNASLVIAVGLEYSFLVTRRCKKSWPHHVTTFLEQIIHSLMQIRCPQLLDPLFIYISITTMKTVSSGEDFKGILKKSWMTSMNMQCGNIMSWLNESNNCARFRRAIRSYIVLVKSWFLTHTMCMALNPKI